jgi:sialate O-acetylesterase
MRIDCSKWRVMLGFLAVWFGLAATGGLLADVKPMALFCDHAVLQQQMPIPVWGTADPGEDVTVTLGDQKAVTKADSHGCWMVKLSPLPAGGPYEMTIAGKNQVVLKDVMIGEVWICSGQSNMAWTVKNAANAEEEIANSANPMIRLFTVPRQAKPEPQKDVEGAWAICGPETVPDFSAVGYFFGRHLQKKLGVAVGLINTSYGGTPAEAWTNWNKLTNMPELTPIVDRFRDALAKYPENLKRYEEALAAHREKARQAKEQGKPFNQRAPSPPMGPEHPHSPAGLYNAMIAPLVPYAIRGAIWYQGESNAGRAYQYRTLFPAMIASWREAWNQGEFPFLFVQLAPYMKIESEPTESAWAELREAQLFTMLNCPNTAMAVITDVGEENDIHPKKKQPVGDRLAIAARALAYGEDIEYSGPIYDRMEIQGNKAVLYFTHVDGGLVCKGDKLTGFTICGEDHKFVNAEAKIEGDTVVVWSDQVEKPVAVRFGWANYPVVNLWNKVDLPASPFRTDDFPGVTKDAQ